MSSAAFWDRAAKKYAASPIAFPDAYAETLDRVRHQLPQKAEVLEVGCGTGSTALLLAENTVRYDATDFSAKMLEIARAKPEAAALPHLNFIQADVVDAPIGPYHAVLAFSVLHLVDDLPAALRAIRARLAPDGLFISKTVCLADLGLWLRVLVPFARLVGLAPPVRFLSGHALERSIRDAGFDIVESADLPAKRAARFVVSRAP
ncbi:MAG: class I SAM-dependent methyltransferase [Pseudomonadota bacterium]